MWADKLNGNGGDSILIGAITDYDLGNAALTFNSKVAALDAIMAQWGSANSYATRVSNLSSALNTTKVHDDAAVDTLFGDLAPDLDWFFAKLGQDVLKNSRPGEVIIAI